MRPNLISDQPIWAIGDLQGCCNELKQLLSTPAIAADLQRYPNTQLWFAGDLVNRGPASLETLRELRALNDQAVCVLGNHDLHLLAVAAGIKASSQQDTLDDILQAPDAQDLIEWLRYRPLAHQQGQYLMVHAGLLPQWNAEKTLSLAHEVETHLRSDHWKNFLASIYGNQPAKWDERLEGEQRYRVIINGLTRLRFCTADGTMDFKIKDNSAQAPTGLYPWFAIPRSSADLTVIFGHWSTLGLYIQENLLGLDSGCVWGGKLSAVRLADRQIVQVSCTQIPLHHLHERAKDKAHGK